MRGSGGKAEPPDLHQQGQKADTIGKKTGKSYAQAAEDQATQSGHKSWPESRQSSAGQAQAKASLRSSPTAGDVQNLRPEHISARLGSSESDL